MPTGAPRALGHGMTDEAAKYDAYESTVLELAPGTRIDLRKPVEHAQLDALKRAGLAEPFAVLTAENPRGANAEDAPTETDEARREAANDRRHALLLDSLRESGVPFVRVDGVAPDGSYRERCVAITGSRESATELAERLGQLALFWFDGAAFWLLPAEADEEPRRLPAG